MMSATSRTRRRGSYTVDGFLEIMRATGFVPVEPSRRQHGGFVLHEFVHPRAGDHHFQVTAGLSYSRALDQFTEELAARQENADAAAA